MRMKAYRDTEIDQISILSLPRIGLTGDWERTGTCLRSERSSEGRRQDLRCVCAGSWQALLTVFLRGGDVIRWQREAGFAVSQRCKREKEGEAGHGVRRNVVLLLRSGGMDRVKAVGFERRMGCVGWDEGKAADVGFHERGSSLYILT